jgi:RNA polymerase sigma factor (TIGR02999 family)
MSDQLQTAVTQMLIDASHGNRQAMDQLTPLVYQELRRLAASKMRQESKGSTLQPTALVHEAYIKLINQHSVQWQNRAHFFAIAAQEMRRILLMHAREKRAQKRGSGDRQITLKEGMALTEAHMEELIALDTALDRLAALDVRQARIVELRFYAELSVDETAEVLEIGTATVKREWAMARAWLLRELGTRAATGREEPV